MRTLALPRISAFVLIASCLLFAQQHSTTAAAVECAAQQQRRIQAHPLPPMSPRNSLRRSRRQMSLGSHPIPFQTSAESEGGGVADTQSAALETKRVIVPPPFAFWV